MHRATLLLVAGVTVSLSAAPVRAQEPEPSVHDELREFRQELVTAVIEGDIATQIELSHPDIVTMWQDGRVAKGHEELRAFLDELGKGTDRGFLGYEKEPTPMARTAVFDDQFGFAHGTSVAQYELFGMEFDLTNFWTAALRKEEGQWKLIGYHVSGNLADNPLLAAAKNTVYVVAAVAALVGILLGFFIGRRSGRSKANEAAVPSG